MLNELKVAKAETVEGLKGSLQEYLAVCPENLVDFFLIQLQETREFFIERSREKILERFHEECWKAAFRWWQMRDQRVHHVAVNVAFGSAISLCAMISLVQSDAMETDMVIIDADPATGYAFVTDPVIPEKKNLN